MGCGLMSETPAGVSQVLSAIAEASRAVEAAFDGAPQDIEGVWADGRATIVQSRPQVV